MDAAEAPGPAPQTAFHLRTWTVFRATPEQVWAVKTDPDRIRAEFRPWLHFCLDAGADLDAALSQGEGGTYAARLLPPGIRWPVRLGKVVPGCSFVDHSENALYSRWEHHHVVQPSPDGCRYIDAVTFTPALPAAKLLALYTQRLFRHRHAVASAWLPTMPRLVGVSVLRTMAPGEDVPAVL